LPEALRSIDMTTNKLSLFGLFKAYGHQIEILRVVKKGSGYSIYLPAAISQVLNLNGDDHLICFVDYESNYPYIVITRDASLTEELRPWIYEKRRRAELLHKKLRGQIEAQHLQAAEVESISEVQK